MNPDRSHTALRAGAVALLALAAGATGLWNGFVWDTSEMVGEEALRSLDGLVAIWTTPGVLRTEGHYWPLTWTTFWVDYQLHGRWAPGWQATSLVLHAAVSVTAGFTLARLGVPGAWVGAALFAVHPVHAEVAAWTIARKDSLAALFALLALRAWWADAERNRMTPWPTLLTAAALLAKSSAVAVAPMLAIAWWWKHGKVSRDVLVLVAWPAAVTVAMVSADIARYATIDTYVLGHDPPTRLGAAGHALAEQARALLVPVERAPIRGAHAGGGAANAAGWAALGAAGALLAVLIGVRERIGRGPAAALACFVCALAPTLGLVEFSFLRFSTAADRFQYLASLAPLALAGAGMARVAERATDRWPRAGGPVSAAVLAAGLGALGLVHANQALVWRDNVRFFESAHAHAPGNAGMHANLVKALADAGRLERSAALARDGAARHPENATFPYRRGQALRKLGRHDEAIGAYEEAIARDPDHAWARVGMGYALRAEGRHPEARDAFVAAARRSPRLRPALLDDIARSELESGRPDRALAAWREAGRIRPHDPAPWANMASVLAGLGRGEEAAAHAQRALAIAPGMKLASDVLAALEAQRGE